MKKYLKKILKFLAENLNTAETSRQARKHNELLINDYLERYLYGHEKYTDPKKLNRYERQAYSQNGEDGIIEEIFKRVGTTNKFFVEFGVGNGLENNTAYLLTKDWQGCWIEGSVDYVNNIKNTFNFLIAEKKLTIANTIITAENIESIFQELKVPVEFDLLSIDIDGNDYWVWEAIKQYRPRVVVAEYNAFFGSEQKWVMKYNPNHRWQNDSYFGASLKSLELLGARKGYKLVGCNFVGVNAFFVREDLLHDYFLEPFTSANHYEPKRNFLVGRRGDKRSFGKFTSI